VAGGYGWRATCTGKGFIIVLVAKYHYNHQVKKDKMGGRKKPQQIWWKNLKEGNHLRDQWIDVKIILKRNDQWIDVRIILKRNGRLWTDFIWFRIGISGGLLLGNFWVGEHLVAYTAHTHLSLLHWRYWCSHLIHSLGNVDRTCWYDVSRPAGLLQEVAPA
jgi:hypothetical protein